MWVCLHMFPGAMDELGSSWKSMFKAFIHAKKRLQTCLKSRITLSVCSLPFVSIEKTQCVIGEARRMKRPKDVRNSLILVSNDMVRWEGFLIVRDLAEDTVGVDSAGTPLKS